MTSTVTSKDIIRQYGDGMASSPSCYTGRGNVLNDLNSGLLEKNYAGVKTQVGASAAKAFVNMVNQMAEDASATTFLVSFERLQQAGWVFRPEDHVSESEALAETASKALKEENQTSIKAMTIGLEFMRLGMQSDTPASAITGWFLLSHAHEVEGTLFPQKNGRKTPIIICTPAGS